MVTEYAIKKVYTVEVRWNNTHYTPIFKHRYEAEAFFDEVVQHIKAVEPDKNNNYFESRPRYGVWQFNEVNNYYINVTLNPQYFENSFSATKSLLDLLEEENNK